MFAYNLAWQFGRHKRIPQGALSKIRQPQHGSHRGLVVELAVLHCTVSRNVGFQRAGRIKDDDAVFIAVAVVRCYCRQ